MRILYSVHRYGEEVVGGAETACRLFAEQLVNRGHAVDVLTSCALSYADWADRLPAGPSQLNGVNVHRLPVVRPRDPQRFSKVHDALMRDPERSSFAEQVQWLEEMGPVLRGHSRNLRERAARADAVVFMTYMYPTTAFGLPVLAGQVPVVLQPTAHDEPPAHVPFYRPVLRAADSYLFLADEEREVAQRVFGIDGPSVVTGIGIDTDQASGDGNRFRTQRGLGADPYLLYMGRVDTFKGVSEVMRYFVEFKGRNPSALKLVLAGEKMMEIPDVEDIRYVGFLDENAKRDALQGAMALVQPSPFESFSIVLCEAWLQAKPVLVQGYSEVLAGQCRRSEGGLPYAGFAEFEACLQRLLDSPVLREELGGNGNRFVRATYSWTSVMERFEHGLELGIEHFGRRTESPGGWWSLDGNHGEVTVAVDALEQ